MTMIWTYNIKSKSAKMLADALKCLRINRNGSTFTGKGDPLVVNWGGTRIPTWEHPVRLLNEPEAVNRASDKGKFFDLLRGDDFVPASTQDKAVAQGWLDDGETVVVRLELEGKKGQGIVVVEPGGELVDAPLYTMYMAKTDEFRIHLFRGEVIDTCRYARMWKVPDAQVNWKVRTEANGFTWVRDREPPMMVVVAATVVMAQLGLDFGGCDVAYNKHNEKALVLEVNTAPYLDEVCAAKYAEKINAVEKAHQDLKA